MTIAVNTRISGDEQPEGYDSFLFECLARLTQKYPQHTFIFIFDKPYPNDLIFTKNVTPVVAGPQAKNPLLVKYWYNYKIPALLKKYKATVFLSMDGICSLRTKLPQCLLVQDLGFLQHPRSEKRPKTKFYNKFTPEFLATAKSIVTLTEFSKTVLVNQYKISADKIDVISFGIDENFKPLPAEEKEIIKEKYADGKEYFLFSGKIDPRNNIINLLKAFSFFKKRQKSNMRLLIAGKPDELFRKELKTFKFRNEVTILDNLSIKELAKITAAAYAMVYPVLYTAFGMAALQAMQCEVPVVTGNSGALFSICGKAALYSNPSDFKDVAENMMLVFKDENKAKELVKVGKIQVEQYKWDKTVNLLWQAVLKCVN